MNLQPLQIRFTPGLPPAESARLFIGRHRSGALYWLRWLAEKGCYGALGFSCTMPKPWPELLLLKQDCAADIIGHAEIAPGLEVDDRGLTPAEQKAQAARCACRGVDDYCPCQNAPDAQTRAARRGEPR